MTDTQTFHVLMDVDRYDPDMGRAWITVEATDYLDAELQVRDLYPNAAVLKSEAA
jgi:hypothetical protein